MNSLKIGNIEIGNIFNVSIYPLEYKTENIILRLNKLINKIVIYKEIYINYKNPCKVLTICYNIVRKGNHHRVVGRLEIKKPSYTDQCIRKVFCIND